MKILFLLIFLPLTLYGQSVTNQLYKIYPSVDSVRMPNLHYESDTVTFILFKPGTCPRCEGLINPFVNRAKNFLNKKVFVFAVADNEKTINDYKKDNNLTPEISVASRDFVRQFSFLGKDYPVTPFAISVKLSTGKVIGKLAFLGIKLDDELVKNFFSITEVSRIVKNEVVRKVIKQDEIVSNINLKSYDSFDMAINGANKDNLTLNFSEDAQRISFESQVSSSVNLYHIPNKEHIVYNRLDTEFYYASTPEMRGDVKKLINRGIAKVIYTYSYPLKNNFILTQTSFPQIIKTSNGGLGYKNKILFQIKNSDTSNLNLVPSSDGIFKKYNSIVDLTGYSEKLNSFIYSYQYGWPTSGTDTDFSKLENEKNPFESNFYKNAPLVLLSNYDKSINIKKGHLSKDFENSHVGYFASGLSYYVAKSDIYLSASYTGEVWRMNAIDTSDITELVIPSWHPNKFPVVRFTNNSDSLMDGLNAFSESCGKWYLTSFGKEGENYYFLISSNNEYYIAKMDSKMKPRYKKIVDMKGDFIKSIFADGTFHIASLKDGKVWLYKAKW